MSQIDIYCPHCTQKLGMNREKFYASLGKKTQCPTCHKYMTLSQDLFHTFRDTSKKDKREPEIERQQETKPKPSLWEKYQQYRKENAYEPKSQPATGQDIVINSFWIAGGVLVAILFAYFIKPRLDSPRKTVATETRVITESRRPQRLSPEAEELRKIRMMQELKYLDDHIRRTHPMLQGIR